MLASALICMMIAPVVRGHGSLTIPQVRNSVDRQAPQWKGGYPKIPDFPGTGRWGLPNETCGTVPWSCQEGCSCSNGTEPCDVGQSCFWFASGCTIGCEACDGNGGRPGDGTMHGVGACRCNDNCINSTLNDPKLRTTNRQAAAGSKEDWTRFNPWRAPGRAPTYGPCGMAGGGPQSGVESGEYNATSFAKQGDLGTNLPEHHGAVWKAGQTAETAWYIRANHGGGYAFRLCKKEGNGSCTAEADFLKLPYLKFEATKLRWNDGVEENITGTYTTQGTYPSGSMWAMNPLPMSASAFSPPCKSGAHPPVRAPMALGKYGDNPGRCAGNWPTTVNIVDTLRVPADTVPGEYVLSWRWDCEGTAQVWNACSDITITA